MTYLTPRAPARATLTPLTVRLDSSRHITEGPGARTSYGALTFAGRYLGALGATMDPAHPAAQELPLIWRVTDALDMLATLQNNPPECILVGTRIGDVVTVAALPAETVGHLSQQTGSALTGFTADDLEYLGASMAWAQYRRVRVLPDAAGALALTTAFLTMDTSLLPIAGYELTSDSRHSCVSFRGRVSA